ncbi:hypothetical protein HD806DRAFT_505254 [Xylariaceae sp. AK1471]|nr:hypothetical protein HD806DRAFT_505254 [Xylariaceae sp. AK1471]
MAGSANLLSINSAQCPPLYVPAAPSPHCCKHCHLQVHSFNWSEEGDIVDKDHPNLTKVQLPDQYLSPALKIVAWSLENVEFRLRREGIITREPRVVVDSNLVKLGHKYSGIFKTVSWFEGPHNTWYRIEGTAFAVGESRALTAGHNVWHRTLGPAKQVALLMDHRADPNDEDYRECVAAAIHAKWVTSDSLRNDFSMVTVAKPFHQQVHTNPCMMTPETSTHIDGTVLGFFKDMPGGAPGMMTPRTSTHIDGIVVGFPKDKPDSAPGKHLIMSKGKVYFNEGLANGVILHRADTAKGNSGGPIFSSGRVVGVHRGYTKDVHANQAVPLNRNGNDVDEFAAAQDFIRNRLSEGLGALEYLGRSTGIDHSKKKTILHFFGQINDMTERE